MIYDRQAGDWHRTSTTVEKINTVAKPRIGIEGYMTGGGPANKTVRGPRAESGTDDI